MVDPLRGARSFLRRRAQSVRAGTASDGAAREDERFVLEAQAEIERLEARKVELLAVRRDLQRRLGPLVGRESMPLSRVEKTNGVPSFVAGVRMMQRIHARADDPAHGHDGAGAVFADRARTLEFLRSHGVPDAVEEAGAAGGRLVVVHAFHGTVGLVEVRQDGSVRHLDGGLADLGDVRPATRHDPELRLPDALPTLVEWAETISGHVSRPYLQVCWTQDGDRLVLDRVDLDPDRLPVLTEEQDVRLGHLFDTGHARMLLQPYRLGALHNRVPGGVFDPETAYAEPSA